ncbi:universal stress protein [Streptomyces jeddahensis]|uniref:Universal stress proteinc n=1 Tax=Streptomyces jeddahensis TaxID=1716141 RepID=A0A177HLP4_9ACTN|nr:universal stress protein [Streptomyces jeddahensis]OAH11881.1 universal stress proteinc [Streptomyces jeddahensis]
MQLPVVVGVDGSEPSFRAAEWAADEAVLHGVQLRVVHASLWERYEGESLADDVGDPSERVIAENIVCAAAERARLRNPEAKICTAILPEDTVTALLRAARNASVLVTGSRGRGGLAGLVLGSVSLAVAGRADCPVIVLRGSLVTHSGHGRVVVGVGEPPRGMAAVRFAFEEAEVRGAELHAVRAWRRPAHDTPNHPLMVGDPAHYLESRAAEILDEALEEAEQDHPGVRLCRRTFEGTARRALREASAMADLLVVGAQRQHGHGHFGLQLGRIAHSMLHHAACPVAVVPQRA